MKRLSNVLRKKVKERFHGDGSAGLCLDQIERGGKLYLYIGQRAEGFSGSLNPKQAEAIHVADAEDPSAVAIQDALMAGLGPLLMSYNWVPATEEYFKAFSKAMRYVAQAAPTPNFGDFQLVHAGWEVHSKQVNPDLDDDAYVEEAASLVFIYEPVTNFGAYHVIVRPGLPVDVVPGHFEVET